MSIKIDDGVKFDGIRFYDKHMTYIIDVVWNTMSASTSTWTDLYAIPENHQIIGVSANASEDEIDYNIRALNFITGPKPIV